MTVSTSTPSTGSDRPQRVVLHPLAMREEGHGWVVGSVDGGRFVALPSVGVSAIELLRAGHTVSETETILHERVGEHVDVAKFISALLRLGFVAEIDGVPVTQVESRRQSFPRVAARHVSWILRPEMLVLVAILVAVAAAGLALNPSSIPTIDDLVWSKHQSLVVLCQATVAWTTIFLHELAHLFTARAAGVSGRITFGTRLQFLCAQTDVSGIWMRPRRTRMAVYTSGMLLNAALASVGIIIILLNQEGAWHTFGVILAVTQVLLISGQLMFFMRTDIYFVAQDLAGCKNLYGDATAYGLHVVRRLVPGVTPSSNPISHLTSRERKWVARYAAFFIPSSMICLTIFFSITLPMAVRIIGGAVIDLTASNASPTDYADSIVVIGMALGFWGLWMRTWWKRHGGKLRAFYLRRRK